MIYLDYQATTPLAPEVFDAMTPWLRDGFANPHSAHKAGRAAAAAVELARGRIGAALGMPGGRIAFTSGATEALNIAIQGAARRNPARRRIVTVATEHAAVRDTVLALAAQGFEAVLLPVMPDGMVDMAAAQEAMGPDVALVAAMLVNNEIGVIQPVELLADMAHDAGALFLCDAVQGFGRVPIPANADMIAISAHKVHGPKGIGALWLRDRLDLPALMHGGGQEQGLRPGTLSPALCAGFGEAARLMQERRQEDAAHIVSLWDRAVTLFADWRINGAADHRYRGNLNICRAGVDAARILSECRDVAMSLGSACASGSGRPSHVLEAIGLDRKDARGSIRLGFGRYTRESELAQAAEQINRAARRQLQGE